MIRIDIPDERIKYVFSVLDTENSGFISAESLRKYFGEDMSESSAAAIIQSADWDGDGRISEK